MQVKGEIIMMRIVLYLVGGFALAVTGALTMAYGVVAAVLPYADNAAGVLPLLVGVVVLATSVAVVAAGLNGLAERYSARGR